MTERRWLVWDNTERGAWHHHTGHGYTLDVRQARRFTEADARALVERSNIDPDRDAVMMLEPNGRVPAPLDGPIADAARALVDAAQFPPPAIATEEYAELVYLVRGIGTDRPACPVCKHTAAHLREDGCLGRFPAATATSDTRCHCLMRTDTPGRAG